MPAPIPTSLQLPRASPSRAKAAEWPRWGAGSPGATRAPLPGRCQPARQGQHGELMEEISLFNGGCITVLLPFRNQFSPRCWIPREVVLLSAKRHHPTSDVFSARFVRSHRDIIVRVATFVLAGRLRPCRWLGGGLSLQIKDCELVTI